MHFNKFFMIWKKQIVMQSPEKGGFVFIDDSSVLSFNFKDNCSAHQTKTGQVSFIVILVSCSQVHMVVWLSTKIHVS